MRTFKICCLSNFQIHNIINHYHHAVDYIPRTYLSYNWKWVPFDCFHPILPPPPPASGNHKSDLFFFFSMSLFVFEVSLTYNTLLVPVTQHRDSVFLYISK